MLYRLWFVAIASSLGAACQPVHGSEPKVTNGVLDLGDPGVVMIYGFRSPTDAPASCTASIIRPNVLLTAAHCVIDHDSGELREIKTAGANSRRQLLVRPHPKYENHSRYDVALIKLDGNVGSGTVLALSSELPKPGAWARVVGFGGNQYTDDRAVVHGAGVKRTGWTKITHLDDHFIYSSGMRNAIPAGGDRPTGRDVALAKGDSGGPLLDADGAIVGVASRTNSQHVSPSETLSILVAHTQIAAVADFIAQTLDEFAGTNLP